MKVLDQKSQSRLLHSELPDAGCGQGTGFRPPPPPPLPAMILEAVHSIAS